MTKQFHVKKKKLLARYNRRILVLNILPIAFVLMLLFMAYFPPETLNIIPYYRFYFLFLTVCMGYSFVTVLAGSLIANSRFKGHMKHSFVEIENGSLIVSRYTQSVFRDGKFIDYKKLWVIDLTKVEDIYYYKGTVIVTAPARCFHEESDWLGFTKSRKGIQFDRWWYDMNGGVLLNGVEIPNDFASGQRIARTIENATGIMRRKEEKRRAFRERMLAIAEKRKA